MKYIVYVGLKHLKYLLGVNLSHIDIFNIAFAHIEDGKVVIPVPKEMNHLTEIRKENPHCKFALSVGGWSADGFSQGIRTATGRAKLAKSMVALVEHYNLDGIDLDWEYPGFSVAGVEAHPDDGAHYVLLLQELRERLDGLVQTEADGADGTTGVSRAGGADDVIGGASSFHKLVTIAVAGDSYYITATPMKELEPYVDYVQIMSYDLRGGFTNVTGHHTNLYQPQFDLTPASADTAVKAYIAAGVPAHKLALGAASYSRQWSGVPNRNNGYGQMAETFGGYGPVYEYLHKHLIDKSGFTRYWDNVAKAPYLFNGETFISYDDPKSLKYKLDYIRTHKLYGLMYWEVADHPNGVLLETLRQCKG